MMMRTATFAAIVAVFAVFVSFGSVVPVDAQGTGWFGQTTVDDFSGETNYVSILPSRVRVNTPGASLRGGDVDMMISCFENTTYVSFSLENGIARDGSFQYRLDDSDVRNAEWDDGNEVITVVGIRAIAFIREISNGRELRVRIPRYSRARIDATFNLEGMTEHVSEVRRLCGW